jgi:hypothetical protein
MPRDWRPLVDEMSNVQKLVHLAARWDMVDEENWRGEILRKMRTAYDEELTIQANRVGCPGRRGQLRNGPLLSALNDTAKEHAASIVNTYNYDLALLILNVGRETPRANRFTYAARYRVWYAARSAWKNPQINEMSIGTARNRAQQDFVAQNGRMGSARLTPTTAVCPVCQGWINRGIVPLNVALNTNMPAHVNCPHVWSIESGRVAREDCPLLWMGE